MKRILLVAALAAAVAVPIAGAHKPRPAPSAQLSGSSAWQIDMGSGSYPLGLATIYPFGTITGAFGPGTYTGTLTDGATYSPCSTAPACAPVSGQFTLALDHCTLSTTAAGLAGLEGARSHDTRTFTLDLTITGTSGRCARSSGVLHLTYSSTYTHIELNGVPTISFVDAGTLTA